MIEYNFYICGHVVWRDSDVDELYEVFRQITRYKTQGILKVADVVIAEGKSPSYRLTLETEAVDDVANGQNCLAFGS